MPANTRSSKARDEAMPYRYGHEQIDFGITGFSFDGGESGDPDYDENVLPLYEYGTWDEVTINVSLTVSNSIKDVFPENEGPPFPAKLIVVIDSPESQMRREEVISEGPIESDTYDDEIKLKRELVRGAVVLTPRLVRTEPCREGLPYAPNKGMRVAGGKSWEVRVDKPEEDQRGFPFRYRDFSQEGMPSEELAHSFSRNPNPKMMVNNQNEGVVDVLQSGGTYGFRPNLKRALKADFGGTLWIQLVILTATTIAEADQPEFSWQEGVVKEIVDSELGEHLFDEDDGYDAVVEKLGESVEDPASLREFITDLCEAVQLYSDYADHLDYFIQEEAP